MRLLGYTAVVALTLQVSARAGADMHEQDIGRPTAQVLDKLERALILPEGAGPLERYSRTYAYRADLRGRLLIEGLLVAGWKVGRQGVHPADMPLSPLDGGCSVITLLYDPAAQRFLEVDCNGVA